MGYEGFSALEGKLAHKPGVTNPGGLARFIGNRKYGAEKMQHAAATGHSLEHAAQKKALGRMR